MRDILPILGSIFFVAALLLPSVRTVMAERRRAKEEDRYFPRLFISGATQRRLFDMARATPDLQMAEISPQKLADFRKRALHEFSRQPTYCAFSFATLSFVDHIGVSYRADVQSPHRVRVLQFLPENDWVDEWIVFDGASYTHAGLWAESPDQTERYQRIQEEFLQSTYLRIFADNEHIGIRTGRLQRTRVVEVAFCGPFGIGSLDRDFAPDGRSADEEDRLSLIFDAEAATLVKVTRRSTLSPRRFENLDDPPDGLIRKDTHIAFARHGEDIEVNPPPWLNAAPNETGQVVITDTRAVPHIPFH